MKNKNTSSQPFTLHLGNNLDALAKYPNQSIHAVVIDGPYGMNSKEYNVQELAKQYLKGENYLLGGKGIVGMDWDSDLPTLALAKELLRVLKPGGFVVCFAAARTYDILVFTLRWAGFQIKDQLIWAYASGVPKGQWLENQAEGVEGLAGLNTALKPAVEPMVLAQKPIPKGVSVLENYEQHGTGALNIGAVQVTRKDGETRYPANIITDGSKVVEKGFAGGDSNFNSCSLSILDELLNPILYYSKAQERDREFGLDKHESEVRRSTLFSGNDTEFKNIHPTVKPLALMRHLVRLVSRPGDTILDCFLGSGSTGCAAILENRRFVGMELNQDYFGVAEARIRRTVELKEKFKVSDPDRLTLLAELEEIELAMQKVADSVLKEPKNKVHHTKLGTLEVKRKVCLSNLKKFTPVAA